MRRKITLDILQAYASEKGGKCLSKKYINPKVLIKWKCDAGHIWEAPWKNMYDGRWCKKCVSESKKLGIGVAKEIAEERGGKCLSKKYINWKGKLKWKCDKGHKWEACLDGVKNGNTWCPECALDKTRLSVKDCQKAAEKFGGKCLSKRYKNAKSVLEWECINGHIWKTKAGTVIHKNKWCPRCRDKSQNALALNIQKIFKNTTIEQKYRGFEWLDTDSGGRQEIDIFLPELKIAIEYDGEGHFYPVNFGGCSDQTAKKIFKKTKKLDKIKNKKIRQHKSEIENFIRFSYKDNIYDIEVVRKKLADNDVVVGDQNG